MCPLIFGLNLPLAGSGGRGGSYMMKTKKKLLAVSLVLLALLAALSAAFPLGFAAGEDAKLIKPNGDETPYSTLAAAMNAAGKGDRILLLKNITVTSQITIKPGVTLDGGGHMIKAGGSEDSWDQGSQHVILFSNNSTLKNVTIDGNGNTVRGVQAWGVTNVRIDNVTIQNAKLHGLKISGSTVIASKLSITNIRHKIWEIWHKDYSIDMESTTNHPVLGQQKSVLILIGTKIHLANDLTAEKKEAIVDARNYTGEDPANTPQPGHISDPDNRYHRILWKGKWNKKTFDQVSHREYITYFNVDEHGNILDANGHSLVNYHTVGEYPAMHPVKEQPVGNHHGISYSVKLEPPPLTREGYALEGWTTEPNGTGTFYQANEIIYGNHNKNANDTWDDDLILYAKWRSTAHTVSYDLGEHPAAGAAAPDPHTQNEGDSFNPHAIAPDAQNQIAASGYEFTGWKDDEDPEGTLYQTTDQFTMPRRPVNFTAQWRLINYTITYKGLEGSDDPGNPTSYTVEDETFTLNNPTKEHYVFKGWKYTENGVEHTEDKTVTIPKGSTGDRTYTAEWTPTEKFTVTFRPGRRGCLAADAQVPEMLTDLEAGAVITLPSIAPGAESGHVGAYKQTFVGWKCSYNNRVYQPGDSFTMPGANVAFTAQWGNYRVMFLVEGGKFRTGQLNLTVYITDGTLHPEDVPTGLIPNENRQPGAEGWKQVGPTNPVNDTVNTTVGGVVAVAGLVKDNNAQGGGVMYKYTFVPIPDPPGP